MYSYNNSMPKYNQNMYYGNNGYDQSNGDRFIGGGVVAPLLLGGIAGYALGNNRPNYNYGYYYPYPTPMPVYNNNYYYPYYY